MGKTWDGGDIAFRPSTWAAIAQHLYPGAWGMVFASSRGWHRLAVAIEDAGLIIQPTIFGWSYGSGFPKATNISAQIDDRAFRAWLDEHSDERAQLENLRQQARLAPKVERVATLRAYQQARKTIKAAAGFAPVAGNKKQTGAKFKLTQEIMDNGGFNASDRESFDVHGPATASAADWAGHRYGGQAVKPALEPIIVFQKPYDGSPLDNITSTGAGALWIDGGRIANPDADLNARQVNFDAMGYGSNRKGTEGIPTHNPMGRWPANLVLTHAPECERIGTRRVKGTKGDADYTITGKQQTTSIVTNIKTGAHYADADGYETIDAWQCIPSCPVARLGAQSGEIKANPNAGTYGGIFGNGKPASDSVYDDSGTASRYFYAADWMLDRLEAADPVAYIAKASTAEREAGLDPRQTALMRLLDEDAADFEDAKAHTVYTGDRSTVIRCPEHDAPIPSGSNTYKCGCAHVRRAQFDPSTVDDGRDVSIDNPYQRGETTRRNIHPTIKPISLSRYLATLLLPPAAYGPRRLLIPFSGAGSEAIGAMLAGWEEITGVELEAEHVAIANARLSYWKQRAWELSDPDRKPTVVSAAAVPSGQRDMFMED